MKNCLPYKQWIFLFPRMFSISAKSFAIAKVAIPAVAVFINITAFAQSNGQDTDEAYIKVITERSAKIVNTLSITDAAKYDAVVKMIASQYAGINTIHNETKKEMDVLKQTSAAGNDTELKKKALEDKKAAALQTLHYTYIKNLESQLNNEQIEKVKDGMTYGVFPNTYKAYLDMIPSLSNEEKEKIYDWLKEARELAMDGESSDAKHAIFGKYKGRINNYLSGRGYDLTKERQGWEQRLKSKGK